MFLCAFNGHHLDLHVPTPSFPTRRSSDLVGRHQGSGQGQQPQGTALRHQAGPEPEARRLHEVGAHSGATRESPARAESGAEPSPGAARLPLPQAGEGLERPSAELPRKKPAQWPAFFSFFAARFSFSVFSGFFFSSFFLSRFLAMTVSAGWVVDAAQMYAAAERPHSAWRRHPLTLCACP